MEYFTSLEKLNIKYTSFNDFKPLQNLENLTELIWSYNFDYDRQSPPVKLM